MDFNEIFKAEDTDKSLQGKSSGVFGLNSAVNVTLLAYTDKAGKKDAEGNPTEGHAFDIHVTVKDREYRVRIYDLTGSDLYNGKQELIKPGQEGYEALYKAEGMQRVAVIKHALKSVGVTDAQINALAPTSFVDYFQKMGALVPQGYQQKPVDVCLEYQWEANDEGKTFLTLPKNMKGGAFLIAHVPAKGSWKEIRTEEEPLAYVDDSGAKHPFARNENFMTSAKAIQQGVQQQANSAAAPIQAGTPAKSSTW